MIEGAVFAGLDRLAPPGPLGLAVSGGGDSLALLLIASRWARARDRRIMAATIDHGLRGAAPAEVAAVARLAASLGVSHCLLEGDAGDAGGTGNLQARARAARYAALTAWAQSEGLAAIATAHTEDDQAETLLMRLARGAGVDGLAGIAEIRQRAGPPPLTVIRPLLGVSRAALRDVLRNEGLGWIEDPTNADPAFDRTRARTALATLAPLGLTAPALAATATRMRATLSMLDAAVAGLAQGRLGQGIAGEILIARDALLGEPETAMRLLARAAKALTAAAYPPRREALERGLAFTRDLPWPPPDQPLADGILLVATNQPASSLFTGPAIALCREEVACAPPVTISDEGTAQDGTAALWDARVGLASGRVGLTLGALGEARLTAIKKAGELTIAGRADGFERFMASPRAARLSAPAAIRADGTLEAVLTRDGWGVPGPPPATPWTTPGVFHNAVARRLSALLEGV